MARSPQPHPQPLTVLLCCLLAISIGLALTRVMPVIPSTLLNALVLAGSARLSASSRSPHRWWSLIGLASGTLIGNGWVLARALQQSHPADHLPGRLATVLLIGCAGALAGHSLGRPASGQPRRRPGDLLRSASSLTAGIFAALVTFTFIHAGLDAARAFSSRLSTALTILVVCLAAPGWLAHLLDRQGPAAAQSDGPSLPAGQPDHEP